MNLSSKWPIFDGLKASEHDFGALKHYCDAWKCYFDALECYFGLSQE